MQYKKLTLPALLLIIPLAASAGSVRSLSAKQVVTGSDGVTYYESNVTCSGKSDPIAIRRAKAGGDWCAADAPDFCDRSKMGAAKDVCGRKYDSYLEDLAAKGGKSEGAGQASASRSETSPQPAPQAAPVAKEQVQEKTPQEDSMQEQQNQLAIEREKLKIEQERLKLKREQIELQKQELEIQRQMKAEAAAKEQAAKKAEAARKAEAVQKAEAKAKAESAPEPEAPAPSSGVKKNVLGM